MEYPKHGLKSWYWSIDRLPILAIYQLISANKLHAILADIRNHDRKVELTGKSHLINSKRLVSQTLPSR